MNESLYISATGLHVTQTRIDAISNNLSNVGTPAFKKARVTFDDMLYRPVSGAAPTLGVDGLQETERLGSGVTFASVTRSFAQGALQPTQRALDFAIQGQGFFEIERADGSLAYSRGGAFVIDEAGDLRTLNGDLLSPAIRVPPDALELLLSEEGEVSVRVPDEVEPLLIGTLELALFMNPDGLEPIGSGMYASTADSGEPFLAAPGREGLGSVRQGFLEASNVDFSQELVELLLAQRAFQLSARALQASDELLAEVNALRRQF